MADTDLLEDFSRLIGERRVTAPTRSRGPAGTTTTETERWERLAPIDPLRTLPDDTAVMVHKNHPPAQVKLRPYYQQKPGTHLGGWLEPSQEETP